MKGTRTHAATHARTHTTNYNSIINQDPHTINKYNTPQGVRGPQVKNGCSTFAMSRYKWADKERVKQQQR
jgi:hypothetical protein